MAFVVEDGTGLANANALCSVAEADAYHTERGVAAWAGSDTVKQQALVRATDFFEGRWGSRLKGERTLATQALSFPRLYIDADGVVPAKIKCAIAEYALRTISGMPLDADPTRDASGQSVKRIKEAIDGAVSVETEFFGSTSSAPSYPAADAFVRDYLRSAGRVYR